MNLKKLMRVKDSSFNMMDAVNLAIDAASPYTQEKVAKYYMREGFTPANFASVDEFADYISKTLENVVYKYGEDDVIRDLEDYGYIY